MTASLSYTRRHHNALLQAEHWSSVILSPLRDHANLTASSTLLVKAAKVLTSNGECNSVVVLVTDLKNVWFEETTEVALVRKAKIYAPTLAASAEDDTEQVFDLVLSLAEGNREGAEYSVRRNPLSTGGIVLNVAVSPSVTGGISFSWAFDLRLVPGTSEFPSSSKDGDAVGVVEVLRDHLVTPLTYFANEMSLRATELKEISQIKSNEVADLETRMAASGQKRKKNSSSEAFHEEEYERISAARLQQQLLEDPVKVAAQMMTQTGTDNPVMQLISQKSNITQPPKSPAQSSSRSSTMSPPAANLSAFPGSARPSYLEHAASLASTVPHFSHTAKELVDEPVIEATSDLEKIESDEKEAVATSRELERRKEMEEKLNKKQDGKSAKKKQKIKAIY